MEGGGGGGGRLLNDDRQSKSTGTVHPRLSSQYKTKDKEKLAGCRECPIIAKVNPV